MGRFGSRVALIRGAVAMLSLAWCGTGVAAEPDAAAIMKQSDAALRALPAENFRCVVRGIGARAFRTPEIDARVSIAPAGKKADFPWLFRVEGTTTWTESARKAMAGTGKDAIDLPGVGAAKFVTAFDGHALRTLREHDRLSIEGAWRVRDEALRDGAGLAATWLLRWPELVSDPFGGGESKLKARYEGQVVVDGTACDAVYVDYSELNDPTLFDGWWYLATSDHLPRRLELNFRENAGDGFLITTIEPKESASLSAESLALALPDGWTVHQAKERERASPARGGGGDGPESGPPIRIGELAPDFSLEDAQGKMHNLSDYRGKVVLLDFWATWCPPCRAAMPGVQKLHEKYGAKGLVALGMNCWENADPAAFMKEQGFMYQLLLKADEVAGKYGVTGIPTFYLIGPDGRIVSGSVGFDAGAEEKLGAKIESLLSAQK
jgi:thiol-disulfide isomerase/thioredoxin